MGTEVQLKSNLPGYYSMRDLNEDSNSCSWPLYNGEKTIQNGHYYNGFLPRAAADIYPGYGKDIVKRTMLEHEAIFKKQVYELHRLYHTQKDLMDEIRRKEAHKNRVPAETSLASSPLMSQVTCEDGRRWHIPNLPVLNSSNTRPAVEGIDSPMSSVKANCTPPATFSCQNGGNFKPSEAPDSRPSKVRRKMFDLQLPADEYIETDDPEQVDHGKDALENFPNRDCKFGSQNGVNILFRESGKTDTMGHALESGLRAKNKNVADLNKPFEVDETNSTAYIDLESRGFSRGDILVQDGSSKPKSLNLGLPYEDAQTSQHGNTESLFSLHQISDRNGRGLFSNMLEAGDIKGKKSVSQSLHSQLRVSSLPVHGLFNEVHQSMLGQNGERTIRGVEISGSAQCPQSVVSSLEKTSSRLSQKPLPFQMHTRTGSSGSYNGCTQIGDRMFGDKWHDRDVRSNAGSGKEVLTQNGFYHGSSLERKELSSQLPLTRYDHLYSDRNLPSKDFSDHPSAKYYGCSSAIDINSRKVDLNVVHENGSSNSLVFPREDGITDKESKPEDHVGILPWLKPKTASQNEATVKSDLNSTGSNVYQSSPLIGKDEARKDPTQMLSQSLRTVSCSYELDVKKCDISASSSNKKILGFPIFEKPTISKNESCSLDSPSASLPRFSEGKAVETEKKVRLLDINLPCDSVSELGKQTSAGTPVMDKGIDSTTASVRHQIDLNSCVSDDETFAMPSVSTTCTNGKRISGIDLEAPVVPDCEEVIFSEDVVKRESERSLSPTQQKTGPPDELIKVAAQAIVAMSSASHQNYLNKTLCRSFESLEDSLNWFVDIILSCGDSTLSRLEASKSKNRRYEDDSSSEETDYFESMTLKLTETKSDEYLPKPFIPETLNVEESAAVASALSRPRRGQARRGRQRRDFQRDILPGLASLSRHEVTEDLQTFGGLMRATGHVWQSGLTRRNSRNGCARGRRRSTGSPSAGTSAGSGCAPLIQQLNNIEAGVGLEERSLTGWGKTTRRPRRQRCPAGNPPSLALT